MHRMIDPSGAWSVADSLDRTGAAVAATLSRLRSHAAGDLPLRPVARSLGWWESAADDLRRRATAIQPRPVPGPEWIQGPPGPRIAHSPEATASFFRGLSPHSRMTLAERFPNQIGPLDGAPLVVRYAANRLLVRSYLANLRLNPPEGSDRLVADVERWAESQLLHFDPSGDGQIVEVLGDLGSARHVAVVVPGVGNSLENYETGLHRRAMALFESAAHPDLAVVAWLAYDTPDDLPAATKNPPVETGESLATFLTGVDAVIARPQHRSGIGHSYGSLVLAKALQAGARPDEVVFIGSPGVGVDHVAELGVPDSTRFWAGRAASDPIRFARGIDCLNPAPICFPSTDRLFFGPDPTQAGFGATRFLVDDTPLGNAHSSYFVENSTSLRNLTFIALGEDDRVTLPSTRTTPATG